MPVRAQLSLTPTNHPPPKGGNDEKEKKDKDKDHNIGAAATNKKKPKADIASARSLARRDSAPADDDED